MRVVNQQVVGNFREVTLDYRQQRIVLQLPFADEASFENCMNAVLCSIVKGETAEYIADG